MIRLVLTLAALGLAACTDTTKHYNDLTTSLEFQGKLRTEFDPADAPFTNADLARNFVEIALFTEFNEADEAERTPTTLSRWEEPIRYQLIGEGVTGEDRTNMRDLASRLERLTNVNVSQNDDEPNFIVMILNPAERRAFNNAVAEKWGDEAAAFQVMWAERLDFPCIARLFNSEEGSLTFGIVLIKDEIKGLFRESCIHEEVVQTLGLSNDSFDVRPSLFNDDEEFALLTRHDEILLQILYDRRLTPGMSLEEVGPLLPQIIADIRPEGST